MRLPLALLMLLALLATRLDWSDNSAGIGPPTRIEGYAQVRDGDSLVIQRRRVRLKGIDAPELAQMCQRNGKAWACGKSAKRHLERLIGRRQVICDVAKQDQFKRLLAHCNVADRDINRAMVQDGMAVAFGRSYLREESQAKQQQRGLWRGRFTRPQQWRRQNPRQ